MEVTATQFKSNFGHYLELSRFEDIWIKKNGKPVAKLLLDRHATVTIAHSRTVDLGAVTRQADVLVVAVGRAGLVTGDMIKPGAVVIDVGMNRNAEGKLCGDVDFASAEPVAGWITPVPGGVGPMTIALLMQNTLRCYHRREGR